MKSMTWAVMAAAGGILGLGGDAAHGQISDENPAPMLQWFECRWVDMERRMPDFFLAGYGRTWLPPVSRGWVWPGAPNQNSDSVGYDPFDRFNLGRPGAETAYGTEASFGRVVQEFHLAATEVYIDLVLNHNSGRQTGAGFMLDGGYPGFWMNPPSPMRDKRPTDDWGDFHAGVATGYRQSENPGGDRYCLLAGDLVALIDIDHSRNNQFIRQPVDAMDPRNIPGGRVFNRPDPANRRFYFDTALGTTTVNNPGMFTGAGELTSPPFGPFPCNVPARNEGAATFTFGRFNTADPGAGDPVPENATGYLLRWTQWMLDVHRVDGFRIDAIKHMPSWFYDRFFDSVVANRRRTPDGRWVTPYSFGECVEGNDFCFDRYVRMPNGRGSGRSAAGDAFGNRDVLDLGGAGALRDLINRSINNLPGGSWSGVLGAHVDSTDDGLTNGSVGVNHIWSHDNGSWGDGNSQPIVPPAVNQGWWAHAYVLMRPGQSKTYHNARGIPRVSGFWPREGVPVALGWDPASGAVNTVNTNLVQLSNQFGRGWYYPKVTDNEVHLFTRATPLAGGGLSGNVLVGVNRSYQGGVTNFDQRTFTTEFPAGTVLVEQTGAWNNPAFPAGTIPRTVTVGAGGSVTVRVPRNITVGGVQHHRGFVVYGPAIPDGTLTLTGVTSTIPADPASAPDARQRLASLPVITAPTFRVVLTTTNGLPGATNNDGADDNAVFRINQGFQDFNGNGVVDIDFTSPVTPGYERFLTVRQPLAGTANATGRYEQEINTASLPEGVNYLSVAAFARRDAGRAPLFRDFRAVFYVDRLPPAATLVPPAPLPAGTTSAEFRVVTDDRTVNSVFLVANPPVGSNPLSFRTIPNVAPRWDRFEYRRPLAGLRDGENTILMIVCEESGTCAVSTSTLLVGDPICPCAADFDGSGGTPDGSDIEAFFSAWIGGDPEADVDCSGGTPDGGDIDTFFSQWINGGC